MGSWESHQGPSSSSRFSTPGIFVDVSIGVSFSDNDRAHVASLKYTSKKMERRMNHQSHHPALLTPGGNPHTYYQPRNSQRPESFQPLHYQQPQHYPQLPPPQNLAIIPPQQYERGHSAPPSVRDSIVSPISPMTPMVPLMRHTISLPQERLERPLPPVPSRFRLGDDDLPWSTPPWYWSEEPEPIHPEIVAFEPESDHSQDPQRIRDLETLQQAMMTVDSLPHDGWETWTWDSVGDMPRGPRSIGWAVSSEDAAALPLSPTGETPEPPPYVVSQWERAFGRRTRPRSVM
ncbi:hypothetical protein B7494_g1818 [Chlorociboria aeruginascens]|nr:hypothetical protein B7494_g1818 [Chlorociboria aeruginascens]